MEARTPKFAGGLTESLLHPFALVLMILAVLLLFVLPRKYAIVPFLCSIFLIPGGQQFVIGGVHFFLVRLLVLAAFIRALSWKASGQKSMCAGGWNSIDTAFVFCVLISATAILIQYPTGAAVVNQLGYLWDFLLAYFALRVFIQNEQDGLLAIKCFAVLMLVLGTGMLIEQIQGTNIFGMLGGVNAVPEIRNGNLRSQAVFQHSLTAGAFAATALPLFFFLWKEGKAKLLAILGVVAATVMTISTQTSTSLLTYAAAIVGIAFWPMRKKMRIVCWGLLAAAIGLHLVMKAPIWFLIARIDLTGSSSSYHRAALIDQFVRHFSSWWLIGTKDAASWGWDMWDTQNMFVSVGQTGGLAALVFYVLVIWRSFVRLGSARKRATESRQEWFLWLLGAALFANVVAFFGVNYFDQVRIAWFVLLAMISAATTPLLKAQPEKTVTPTIAPATSDELVCVPSPVHSISRYLTQ